MINNQRFWLTTQSKGDHKKGLHITQIKKKEDETFCIFPRANQQKVSPFMCKKEEEGNLFDFNDIRLELVLEILQYMTAARKDRALVL